ncbi:MAG: hypothetical protein EOO20_26940, partial [Chryseobacterium sp.]
MKKNILVLVALTVSFLSWAADPIRITGNGGTISAETEPSSLTEKSDKLIRTKNYYESNNLVLSNGTMGFLSDKGRESFHYESSEGLSKISFYDIRKNEQEFFELAYA